MPFIEKRTNVTELLFDGRGFDALLFDMDGTLISSTASAERVWAAWARRHGIDVETFLPTIHGVRSVETIRRQNIPGVDPEREAAAITELEMADVEDIVPILGAVRFLASLPKGRWAIVTSAPRELARVRLAAAGVPIPETIVTAEDVKDGKPDPACFLLGAKRLGVEAATCLVFEDAEAGLLAAEAAAAEAIVIGRHGGAPAARHPGLENYEGVEAVIAPDGRISVSRDAATRRA